MGLLKNSPRWKIYPQSQTNHLQSKNCLSISRLLSCLLNLAAATLPLSSNHTQQKWPQLPKKIRTVSLSLSNKVQEKKFVIRF